MCRFGIRGYFSDHLFWAIAKDHILEKELTSLLEDSYSAVISFLILFVHLSSSKQVIRKNKLWQDNHHLLILASTVDSPMEIG